MKKIDIYILKRLAIYLLSSSVVIFVFIFTINLFETIDSSKMIFSRHTVLKTIYTTPYYFYLVIPIIVMVSVLLLFNYLKSSSEYKAIYSSGYSNLVFLKIPIVFVIAIILFMIFIADPYTTVLYRKSRYKKIYSQVINIKIDNKFVKGYLKDNYRIEDAYIEDDNFYYYVQTLLWDDFQKKWFGKNVFEIKKIDGMPFTKIEIKEFDLPSPDNFILEEISDYNAYSMFDFIERAKKLRNIHLSPNMEVTTLFFRLSIIFVSLLGIFISYIIFKTPIIYHKGYAVALAVLVSPIIWFIITLSKRLSDIQVIPPWAVLLIPHAIMFLVLYYFAIKLKELS